MEREYFWLSERQFARLEPHLPTDTRGTPRVDGRRVISGIIHHNRQTALLGWLAFLDTVRTERFADVLSLPPIMQSGTVGCIITTGGVCLNAENNEPNFPLRHGLPGPIRWQCRRPRSSLLRTSAKRYHPL